MMSDICPFCAEPVPVAAVICPHCRSHLHASIENEAYRNRPGRQIGGVAIGLSYSLGISVTLLRLLFIVFTFVSFIGPIVYVTMWLLLPNEPGGPAPLAGLLRSLDGEKGGDPSLLERGIQWLRRHLDRLQQWYRSKKGSTEEIS
ncbi:MAG TPA: PspC domain-containing protein [Vicinamibacteria bacterium]|nr:PspC domain-containing protein [Vicinamibacteria bacterium]